MTLKKHLINTLLQSTFEETQYEKLDRLILSFQYEDEVLNFISRKGSILNYYKEILYSIIVNHGQIKQFYEYIKNPLELVESKSNFYTLLTPYFSQDFLKELFNFQTNYRGKTVGKGEFLFILLFKDVTFAEPYGDLRYKDTTIEVKGSGSIPVIGRHSTISLSADRMVVKYLRNYLGVSLVKGRILKKLNKELSQLLEEYTLEHIGEILYGAYVDSYPDIRFDRKEFSKYFNSGIFDWKGLELFICSKIVYKYIGSKLTEKYLFVDRSGRFCLYLQEDIIKLLGNEIQIYLRDGLPRWGSRYAGYRVPK